jgi:hypothetical protein
VGLDEPYTRRGPVWPELLAWLRSLAGPGHNILQYTQEWNLRKLRGQLGLAKGGGIVRVV